MGWISIFGKNHSLASDGLRFQVLYWNLQLAEVGKSALASPCLALSSSGRYCYTVDTLHVCSAISLEEAHGILRKFANRCCHVTDTTAKQARWCLFIIALPKAEETKSQRSKRDEKDVDYPNVS